MKPASRITVAALLLLVAGCGTTGARVDVTTEPTPNSGDTTGANTKLTVEVRTAPGKGERTYTLLCSPPGGNHPDPEAACRALTRRDDPFAPVPPDAVCTELYGGPQTASVTGTLKGKPVDARFSRTDGCQIDRWDSHAALLLERGGIGGKLSGDSLRDPTPSTRASQRRSRAAARRGGTRAHCRLG